MSILVITSTKIQQKAITSAYNMAITSAIIIKILNDNIFRYTFSNTNQHMGKLNIFLYTWESHVRVTGKSLW